MNSQVTAWLGVGLILSGCLASRGGSRNNAYLARISVEMAGLVSAVADTGEVAVLAWRDGVGEQTGLTEVVDDYVISALLREGVSLALPPSDQEKWNTTAALSSVAMGRVSTPRVVGGRLHEDAAWIYLRLFVVDRYTFSLLQTGTWRLTRNELQRLASQRSQMVEREESEQTIEVQFSVLALRDQSGFAEPVVLEEGAVLLAGDQLQIRFTAAADCEVYSFLYTSEGTRVDVLTRRVVYAGRLEYGPGEEQWISLHESGQIYTLYFLAAPRLDDDQVEFFGELERLIRERKVTRFDGLEHLDSQVNAYIVRSLGGDSVIDVVRGKDRVARGRQLEMILVDGTPISVQPEQLRGTPAVARAISFEVQ